MRFQRRFPWLNLYKYAKRPRGVRLFCLLFKNLISMKIVQSFWSAGKDVYADGFGWRHAELYFMSWALSCLSLRLVAGR